jgi:hypothetical protein
MIFSQKEKEDLVTKLLGEQYPFKEIAKRVHMSFSDISKIKRKITGEDVKEKENNEKQLSITSQAFKLFKEGNSLVDVVIFLDIPTEEVLKIFSNYLTLQNMGRVATILKVHRNNLAPFVKLFNFIKQNNTKTKDIVHAIEYVNNLKNLENQKENLEKDAADDI